MKRSIWLIIFVLLFVSGCSLFSADKKRKHYYQLYYRGRSLTNEPVHASVFVKTVEVDRLYRRSNLVYRTSAFELFYYFYHYWAVRPQDMLSDAIYRHLKESNIVTTPLAEMDRIPDYIIISRLFSLDEIDSEEQRFARIAMNYSLIDAKSNKVIASYVFDTRQEVTNTTSPVFVVRAFSSIMEKQTEIFLKKAYKALKKTERQKQKQKPQPQQTTPDTMEAVPEEADSVDNAADQAVDETENGE